MILQNSTTVLHGWGLVMEQLPRDVLTQGRQLLRAWAHSVLIGADLYPNSLKLLQDVATQSSWRQSFRREDVVLQFLV